jgi:DNA polymerase
VFIANMIKCRAPDNRDPQPAEMTACSKYLDRQIELINPKIIVTLGRFSLGRFFPGESITRARGRLRQKDGRLIFPVMHPAAVLRRPELRATMVEDFRAIAAALETAPEPEFESAMATSSANAVPADPERQEMQMGLFGSPAASVVDQDGTSPDTVSPDEPDPPDTPANPPDPQQLSMF